ncbi:pyridoxal phosphate-dependent aminotransferase [Bifidobacterium cuniculi]|uniref:Aminotransferase n=1 Tax=Bifidobacterium cuniculi TaxID=1688 RepID=A0A087B2J7_9BIFI|nr:aminotransferase class I/II-fold pyridoxal phosphate-dependent enzyme [Bifidobacterium cuniculi]KFI65247.1 transaminase [Bifidobacterium cuniculi]
MAIVQFSRQARAIPPNVFERMDRTVAAARARSIDVIDLSKGNPDGFPDAAVRRIAREAVDAPGNARYTPFDGKPGYLAAAAAWYRREHGVVLDPARQLFAVEGAVDGLACAFQVLLDPGDSVAMVDPYYPSYHCMARMLSAREELLPARADLGWLPDLDAVSGDTWDRTKLLVLNYPNNPTGAQAPHGFLAKAVELAHRHRFAILHDFAYAGLSVSEPQPSLLSIDGAQDVALEIVSLSKMGSMAGWRAGFVAGNEELVHAVKQYHYQMGSMVTSFVQDAASYVLESGTEEVQRLARRYARRRATVTTGLGALGYDVFDAPGGLYAWIGAPHGTDGAGLSAQWLEEAGVAVLDGACFGRAGRGYVRMSLLQPNSRLAEAVSRIATSCNTPAAAALSAASSTTW